MTIAEQIWIGLGLIALIGAIGMAVIDTRRQRSFEEWERRSRARREEVERAARREL